MQGHTPGRPPQSPRGWASSPYGPLPLTQMQLSIPALARSRPNATAPPQPTAQGFCSPCKALRARTFWGLKCKALLVPRKAVHRKCRPQIVLLLHLPGAPGSGPKPLCRGLRFLVRSSLVTWGVAFSHCAGGSAPPPNFPGLSPGGPRPRGLFHCIIPLLPGSPPGALSGHCRGSAAG